MIPSLPPSPSYLEEEISNMRKELEKYGIQMPAFSKIGGILASELSVDEAACKFVHVGEEHSSVFLDNIPISLNATCLKI